MDKKCLLIVIICLSALCETKKNSGRKFDKKSNCEVEIQFGGLPFKVEGNLTMLVKSKDAQQRIELNGDKRTQTFTKGDTSIFKIYLEHKLKKINEIGLTFNDTNPKVLSTIYVRQIILKKEKKGILKDLRGANKKSFCAKEGNEALTEAQELKLTAENCKKSK